MTFYNFATNFGFHFRILLLLISCLSSLALFHSCLCLPHFYGNSLVVLNEFRIFAILPKLGNDSKEFLFFLSPQVIRIVIIIIIVGMRLPLSSSPCTLHYPQLGVKWEASITSSVSVLYA